VREENDRETQKRGTASLFLKDRGAYKKRDQDLVYTHFPRFPKNLPVQGHVEVIWKARPGNKKVSAQKGRKSELFSARKKYIESVRIQSNEQLCT